MIYNILTVLLQHLKTAFCLLAVNGLQCVLLHPLGAKQKGAKKQDGTVRSF